MIPKRPLLLAAGSFAGSMLVKAGIMMLRKTLIVMTPSNKHNESTWWMCPCIQPRKDARLTALTTLVKNDRAELMPQVRDQASTVRPESIKRGSEGGGEQIYMRFPHLQQATLGDVPWEWSTCSTLRGRNSISGDSTNPIGDLWYSRQKDDWVQGR